MSFAYDPFALLGVDVQHDLDMDLLERKYIEAQKQVHPDQMEGILSDSAVTLSALVNQAYADLKDPVMRARRMLERVGITISPEHFGHVALEMMNWIEAEDTDWAKEYGLIEKDFRKKWQTQDWYGATEAYFKWCYIRKHLQSGGVRNVGSN